MFVLVLVLPPGSCACFLLKRSLEQGVIGHVLHHHDHSWNEPQEQYQPGYDAAPSKGFKGHTFPDMAKGSKGEDRHTTTPKVFMQTQEVLNHYGQLATTNDFRDLFFNEFDFASELARNLVNAYYTSAQNNDGLVILQVAWGPSQIVLPLQGKWPRYFKPVPPYSNRIQFVQQC